jgi:hypothetical protein
MISRKYDVETLKQGRRRTALVCCASDSFSSCSGKAIQGGTLVVGAGWRRRAVGLVYFWHREGRVYCRSYCEQIQAEGFCIRV